MSFRWCAAILASLAALLGGSPALAHEKWFHDDPTSYPLRLDLLLRPLPLALMALVAVATLLGARLWRARGRRGFLPGPRELGASPARRAALYGVVPAILGVHIAVPLLVRGVQGQLFSVDNSVAGGLAYLVGLLQTGVALALFYGGFARAAALVLAGLWVAGIALRGLEPMLENAHFLGLAAFFYLAGRGPLAVDRLLFPRLEPPARLVRLAVPALRLGLGASLVVVAFTEKLANLPLATSFLEQFPLNFTRALPVALSDEAFVLAAGSVELLIGLWLMLGLFPREIILVAWLPFNLTLSVFNWGELIGHLPFYGILAVLLVWQGDREDERRWLDGMRAGPLAVEEPGPGQTARAA